MLCLIWIDFLVRNNEMSVTVALVKELREKSGAGMMDCKKALGETEGEWMLRLVFGQRIAATKNLVVLTEGLVGIAVDGKKGAVVELNAETDFVARNGEFQAFVSSLANLALGAADLAELKTLDFPKTGRNVADELTQKIATIGENMSLRRMHSLNVSHGAVVPYMHNSIAAGLGRIGVFEVALGQQLMRQH